MDSTEHGVGEALMEAGTFAILATFKKTTLDYVLMPLAHESWTQDEIWEAFVLGTVIAYFSKFGPAFAILAVERSGLYEGYRIRPKEEEMNSPELYQAMTYNVIKRLCIDVFYFMLLIGLITHVTRPLGAEHNLILTFFRTCLWVELGDINFYWLHRAQHTFTWLYRIHKMHHEVRTAHVYASFYVHWIGQLSIMMCFIVSLGELAAIESLFNLALPGLFQPSTFHFIIWGIVWIHAENCMDHYKYHIPGLWIYFVVGRPWKAYDQFTVGEQTRAHEIHHRLNRGNFGFITRHDKWWGTFIRPNMNRKELDEEMRQKHERAEMRRRRKEAAKKKEEPLISDDPSPQEKEDSEKVKSADGKQKLQDEEDSETDSEQRLILTRTFTGQFRGEPEFH